VDDLLAFARMLGETPQAHQDIRAAAYAALG
jgi:hypothetical protein